MDIKPVDRRRGNYSSYMLTIDHGYQVVGFIKSGQVAPDNSCTNSPRFKLKCCNCGEIKYLKCKVFVDGTGVPLCYCQTKSYEIERAYRSRVGELVNGKLKIEEYFQKSQGSTLRHMYRIKCIKCGSIGTTRADAVVDGFSGSHICKCKYLETPRKKYLYKKIGSLFIYNLRYPPNSTGDSDIVADCTCDCDLDKSIPQTYTYQLKEILTGSIKSCGCSVNLNKPYERKYCRDNYCNPDYIGEIFGNLQVLDSFAGMDISGNTRWRMRCLHCNDEIVITAKDVIDIYTRPNSCGCRRNQAENSERLIAFFNKIGIDARATTISFPETLGQTLCFLDIAVQTVNQDNEMIVIRKPKWCIWVCEDSVETRLKLPTDKCRITRIQEYRQQLVKYCMDNQLTLLELNMLNQTDMFDIENVDKNIQTLLLFLQRYVFNNFMFNSIVSAKYDAKYREKLNLLNYVQHPADLYPYQVLTY